jgi:hypothetical protein
VSRGCGGILVGVRSVCGGLCARDDDARTGRDARGQHDWRGALSDCAVQRHHWRGAAAAVSFRSSHRLCQRVVQRSGRDGRHGRHHHLRPRQCRPHAGLTGSLAEKRSCVASARETAPTQCWDPPKIDEQKKSAFFQKKFLYRKQKEVCCNKEALSWRVLFFILLSSFFSNFFFFFFSLFLTRLGLVESSEREVCSALLAECVDSAPSISLFLFSFFSFFFFFFFFGFFYWT